MAKRESNTSQLGLRGKDINELRGLVLRFLDLSPAEVNALDKPTLISQLSQASSDMPALAREIRKADVAFKPSFYVMVLAPKDHVRPSRDSAISLLNQEFFQINDLSSSRPSVSTYKEFRVERLIEHDGNTIEIHFTWQRVHWYWKPVDVSMSHIYELQFGFAILDFASRKAIIACHNENERRTIVRAIHKVYPVSLSPLVLTKPVLDQIGSFDHVRRAGYFILDPDPSTPSNITYADDRLAVKSVARSEEEDPRSQRKHSFYLIPLGSIEEQGVGATSDSGKLWIPRELPVDSVREYGIALLERIGRTLDNMTERGEYDRVLASMGIDRLLGISAVQSTTLRSEVCRLVEHLVNMLLAEESSRPFTMTECLATDGVPNLLQYPRLQLTDPETGDTAFWIDSNTSSQMVRLVSIYGNLVVISHPSKDELDLSKLRHPITGSRVEITHPLANLHLLPTTKLHEVVFEAIEHISHQIPKLRKIVSLPFRISSNQLMLEVNRAFGRAGLSAIGAVLSPSDLREMQRPMHQYIAPSDEPNIRSRLRKLGEQCVHMSDYNCRSCVQNEQYMCLRSLIARYVKEPLLLAHKGIELSDIQGKATLRDEEITFFGFAKLAQGNGSLTARNKNGAILLAQVLGQVDKTTFDTAVVISPSTINEDLRDRLRMICGVFNKRLLFLDYNALARLLLHFEEQAAFDNIDVKKIYAASRPKRHSSKRGRTA